MANWGECDFSSLQAMANRFRTAISSHAAEQLTCEILQELGNMLLRATKHATPVDTGHLKRNWFISNVRRRGDIFEIEIYNNVEYAPWVENGHRIVRNGHTVGFVEGRYMLRISLAELERKASEIYSARAQQFLQSLLGGTI